MTGAASSFFFSEFIALIAMKIAGPLKAERSPLVQASDEGFELDYLEAQTAGKAMKRFNRDGAAVVTRRPANRVWASALVQRPTFPAPAKVSSVMSSIFSPSR